MALGFMLLSTLLLAIMHALVRLLGNDLHPFIIVFFRNLFGLIAILPLLIKGGKQSLATNNPKLHLIRALVGTAAMASWFFALTRVPIANATALSFSTAIFATVCAWFFLNETVRLRRGIAIGVGFAGVFVAMQPDATGFNNYSLLVLLSAITWGASVSIVKLLTRTESVTCIVGWMAILLTIITFIPAILVWQTPELTQMALLMVIGALATAGHLLMTRARQLGDTALVMSVDFSRLIWTSILGVWWFGETLTGYTFIGAAIIFGAGLYIVFRESRMSRP